MKRLLPLLVLAWAALNPQMQADVCKVQTWLTATAEAPEAVCKLSLSMAKSRSTLMLHAQGLKPMGTYQVRVNGIERGSFTTNAHGTSALIFYAPSLTSRLKLDFEPRGKHVQITSFGKVLLEGGLSAVGEHTQSEVTDASLLELVEAKQGSRAAVTFHRTKQGLSSLNVAVSGVINAPLQVLLQGHEIGSIQPRNGQGVLLMRNGEARGPWATLPVDPRGQGIDIRQEGKLLFSGRVLARGQGVNLSPPMNVQLPLQKMPVAGAASGRAEFMLSSQAVQGFRLRLDDLALGHYELLVNGMSEHTFEVTGSQTVLDFSSDPMLGQLPLRFSPLGSELSVQRANDAYLRVLFQPELLQVMPKPEPATQLIEQLTATGASAVAEAVASYAVDEQGTHALQVKLLHAPAGIYRLRVGNVVRGVIRCTGTSAETLGQAEFRTVPEPGTLLLHFDPRGQTMEIVDLKGTVFFHHCYGAGSAKLTERAIVPVEWLLPMFAMNGAMGTVEMQYRSSKHGEWLCLKLQNTAEGAYELRVGEHLWHEFQVQGASGRVELTRQSKPSVAKWNLSPRGQNLTLWYEGKLCFQRKLVY